MAEKIHGKNAVIQIEDSGGTLRTVTSDFDNADAPTNMDNADQLGYGDASHSYLIGAQNTPIGLSGFVRGTAVTEAHAILAGLLRGTGTGGSAGYDFRLCPNGTAVGNIRMRGRVVETAYNVQAPASGAVKFNSTLMPATSTGLVWEAIS